MPKVFHFHSPAEPYICDAVVLCCDHRCNLVARKFLKRLGVSRRDLMVLVGGRKPLTSPRSNHQLDFVLDQIRLSMGLHGVLMNHSDGGAFLTWTGVAIS